MTFERTFDMQLAREVITHPKVWPWISDDGSPARESFVPENHPGNLYLLCFDGETLLGLWLFVKRNAVTVEVHTCLLPHHGFHRGRVAARQAAEWIWANTDVQRIITSVPETLRIALRFAQAAGMVEFGRNLKSFLKNGRLWDEVLLGISRPVRTN